MSTVQLWLPFQNVIFLSELLDDHRDALKARKSEVIDLCRRMARGREPKPRGSSSSSEGRVISSGDRLIVLRALKAGMRDPKDGQRIGAVAAGRDDRANPFLYGLM